MQAGHLKKTSFCAIFGLIIVSLDKTNRLKIFNAVIVLAIYLSMVLGSGQTKARVRRRPFGHLQCNLKEMYGGESFRSRLTTNSHLLSLTLSPQAF